MSTELAVSAPMFGLSTLDEAVSFAGQMAKANLLPAHLKGSPADCLRVVMQAARWQMDPFAVADKTSVINGKLMHEGQLVSAVVNARGGLAKRLTYDFTGTGPTRLLTVSGTIKGEDEPRTIELTHALATKINRNGQMTINPDQQMTYIGARMWARRHTPELMLGVYTPDEIDPDEPEKNVTGTAEEATGTTETKVERPKVKRSARGAAAATETPAEPAIETTATPVADKPTEPVTSAVPTPAAESPASPVTTLKDAEVREFKGCRVISVIADNFGNATKPRLAVKAEVDGPFKGAVFHQDAAFWKDANDHAKGCVADEAWKVDGTVNLTLYGRAYPNPGPKAGQVAVLVKAIEVVAVQAEDELP